jgi:trimeric autotransporter adhesin
MKKITLILIGCFLYFQPYAQVNLDSGLVGYYPMDGNAHDESGFGFNGAVTGAVLTTDRFGHSNNAYYFDGYGDRIEVANTNGHFNLNYLTLSAWVRPDTWVHELGAIVYKNAQTGYNRDNYYLGVQYHESAAPVRSTSTYYNLKIFSHIEEYSTTLDDCHFNNYQPFSAFYTIQNWYLATTVYDPYGVSIYVNGVLEDRVLIQNITPWQGPAPLLIGSLTYSTHPNGDFHGVIDDVRIYNRPLSNAEISALYNQANGIAETVNSQNISFYPNPVTDVLSINGIDIQGSMLSIYSVEGRLLIQTKLKMGYNTVNLNELEKGVYLIQIKSDKETISERLIKQ